jgi:cytidylate kinase
VRVFCAGTINAVSQGFTIAIDGPAAAGKGTIARAVADHFGFAHLDTGLLYRAVGAQTLLGVDPLEAAAALSPEMLSPDELRGAEVAQAASRVAADPQVRAALVDFQRSFAARAGGAVLDGRDIGTVICPDAPAKLFITASAEVRAIRRQAELEARGEPMPLAAVLADVRERDARDASRATAPLKPAEDAVEIDTSDMQIDDAIAAAVAAVNDRRATSV